MTIDKLLKELEKLGVHVTFDNDYKTSMKEGKVHIEGALKYTVDVDLADALILINALNGSVEIPLKTKSETLKGK